MLRIENRVLAQRTCELRKEIAVGFREGEAHRVVIDLLDLQRLAAGGVARGCRGVLRIEDEVLDVEKNVVGGERLAVRPLHALAQVEGEHLAARIDLVALGDVRDDFGVLRVPANQPLSADHAKDVVVVGAAAQAEAELAAILADALERLHDFGFISNPLFNRRQLARLNGCGEGGRLLVLESEGRRRQREQRRPQCGKIGDWAVAFHEQSSQSNPDGSLSLFSVPGSVPRCF